MPVKTKIAARADAVARKVLQALIEGDEDKAYDLYWEPVGGEPSVNDRAGEHEKKRRWQEAMTRHGVILKGLYTPHSRNPYDALRKLTRNKAERRKLLLEEMIAKGQGRLASRWLRQAAQKPLTSWERKQLPKANVWVMDWEMDGGTLPRDVQRLGR
jgi:hypothetical protein